MEKKIDFLTVKQKNQQTFREMFVRNICGGKSNFFKQESFQEEEGASSIKYLQTINHKMVILSNI